MGPSGWYRKSLESLLISLLKQVVVERPEDAAVTEGSPVKSCLAVYQLYYVVEHSFLFVRSWSLIKNILSLNLNFTKVLGEPEMNHVKLLL